MSEHGSTSGAATAEDWGSVERFEPGESHGAVTRCAATAALGGFGAGRIADRFGRLKAMWAAAALFLVSAIGTGLSGSLPLLIGFRVIGGVAVGAASVIAPAYIAEIAPARIRGRLGSLQQLAIVTGIFLALLVDYVLATAAGGSEKDLALGLVPIVWVGIGLSVFQQFVGINVIFYYSSILWQAVGFNENDSLIITVVTSVVNIVTTLVAIASIDKFGRKPLLLIGSAGMTVTLGVMALIFGTAPLNASGEPVLNGLAGPIALVAANLFVFSFGMSWGPVVWVLLGESFPNRIRAAALSLAAAAQWVANWAISTSFPALKNAGLGLAYGIYAACALLSLLFVMRLVRETKGQELEAMTDEVRVMAPH